MPTRYEIGDLISGSNLTENFKGQDLTCVGIIRGSDRPVLILKSHPETSPVLLCDLEGNPIDFLVVSESHMTPIPEATAKFGAYWARRRPTRASQSKEVGHHKSVAA
jgi:hypothetical protein